MIDFNQSIIDNNESILKSINQPLITMIDFNQSIIDDITMNQL